MGSAITPINFPCTLTVKERYNPRDYFREGIIEEINLWFISSMCKNDAKMMRKLKIKVRGMRRKKVKIYIRHSQKNVRLYVDSFLEAYLGPSSTFSYFVNTDNSFWPLMLHRRCSTGFLIGLRFFPTTILFL